MAGRLTICVLTACCLLPMESGWAQGGLWGAPTVHNSVRPPAAHVCGPGCDGLHGFPPPAARFPPQYATPESAVSGVGYYGPDGVITTRAPEYSDNFGESPFEVFLKRATQNSWMRFEYMLMEVDAPGRVPLGAEQRGVNDVRDPFPVFDPATLNQIGFAQVPDLGEISFRGLNGIRGTFGVPLSFGAFEASVFAIEQGSDKFDVNGLPSNNLVPGEARFAATTTLVNGQVANNVLTYDRSFDARYTTQVFATDAILVFDNNPSGEGLKLMPLIGFRYINLREDLHQVGVFDGFGAFTPVTSTIVAETNNHLYAGVLGLRAELVHRWFTVGVEPRIDLGLNTYKTRVTTNNLRSNFDPVVRTQDQSTQFTPMGELGFYARVNLNESISLRVGYNVIWLPRVVRPGNSILYNDNGGLPTLPAVVARPDNDDIKFDGLTVGLEILFH